MSLFAIGAGFLRVFAHINHRSLIGLELGVRRTLLDEKCAPDFHRGDKLALMNIVSFFSYFFILIASSR